MHNFRSWNSAVSLCNVIRTCPSSGVHTAHCTLHTAHCTLCTLHTAHCTLPCTGQISLPILFQDLRPTWSRDTSVGIASRYGLGGPGIESRCGDIFRTYPDRLRGPPSLLYSGYRVFLWGKGGRGVMLTTHPRLRKSWAIPPLTLWVLLRPITRFPYAQLTQQRIIKAACMFHKQRAKITVIHPHFLSLLYYSKGKKYRIGCLVVTSHPMNGEGKARHII
jgi:hypothetical protein